MFYFAKFCGRNITYEALWLVSRPVLTNIEWSVDELAFESLFPMWKCLLLKEKCWNFYFEIEFRNKFIMWKGPYNRNLFSDVKDHGEIGTGSPHRNLFSMDQYNTIQYYFNKEAVRTQLRHRWNITPYVGAKRRWGELKSATFDE